MFNLDDNKPHVFALGFVALTLVPGVWTVATTSVSGIGFQISAGETQRLYEERFEDSFPLAKEFRTGWAAFKFATLGETAEGAIAGPAGTLFTAEEFQAPTDTRDFVETLAIVQKQIEASGAALIPVIVPDKVRMMGGAQFIERSVAFDSRYDTLLGHIKVAGLRTVDLRPSLSSAGSYMTTDTHWSPQGAQAVAMELANLFANEIETTSEFTTQNSGSRNFDGDLLAFVDTGRWRKMVGPQQERIDTFKTRSVASGSDDGMGLFGDPVVPVTLVGTSFSAREDFHFTGFLKSSLKADVVSYAMEGRGPFVPMDRFLESGDLQAATPQFVIWEIPERYLSTWSQNQ